MNPDEVLRGLDASAEFMMTPSQVVQAVVDHRWTFAISHCPRQLSSDEEPPHRLDERTELFPICKLLGLYTPARQEITVFRRGVEQVAQRLDLRKEDIACVVRLHEWAHALLHVGLPEDERLRVTQHEELWTSSLAKCTAMFHTLEPALHERLAQLITYHSLDLLRSKATLSEAKTAVDRKAAAFELLMKHQPADYRVDKYLTVPRQRLVTSIGFLKDQSLVGLKTWDTVFTW